MAEPLEEFCGGAKFWDLEVVWNTTNPDLPECFQKTVLVWIPFGFLWAFTPLQAYYLRKSTKRTIPWTGLNIAKIALGAILSLLMLADVSHSVHLYNNDVDVPMVDFYSPFIKFITFILITLLIYLEKQRGIQSTGVTFIFWFLVLIAACVSFRTHIEKLDEIEKTVNMFEFVVQMIYFALVPAEFVLHCFSDAAPKDKVRLEINKSSEKDTLPKTMCPEDNSSFFSRILFSWFDSLAVLGYKRPLEHKDLWVLNYVDSSRNIAAKFEADWKTEVLKYSRPNTNQSAKFSGNGVDVKFKSPTTKRQPSLLRVLWKSFGAYFLLGSFLQFISDLLVFANPMLLKLLIEFVSNPNEPLWRGYMYAALILVAALVQSVVVNQHFHIMFLTGMRVRSAVISSVYTKAMRMSNSAKRSSTVGEIVNLMSVDAQRFVDLTTYLNVVWSAPLQIIISLVLLWGSLGPSVLSGVVIMILLIPANGVIARINQQLQIKQMKNKDQRVKLMNEVLSGMKVLKLYAWEHSFEQQISAIRNKELKVLKTTAYLNALTMFIWLCAPFIVMLATFTTYVLISEENILDASKAFVSLSLFDIMRRPMTVLPIVIVSIVQASVSMKRMNKFLNNDELDPLVVTHNPKDGCPLVIEDGTFSWGPDDDPVLQNINLEVVDGSLVAVVGPVGSGKSSLVAALLGEMEKLDGRVNTKGTIAYVAQQAWIQNASLKQNILFGNAFDGEKYSSIIEACALKPDFEMLPGGDDTEIGEKGINLSGGQKQRVSLARAVYNDSEVYFLDDPLSAVDSHVGKHIFDKVIGPDGLLKRKTRILVTHGITYLPQVDTIVVLNDGHISEVGSYQELLDKKGAFADFLMMYLTEQADVDDLEDLDELKDELIEKLGPELERRLSRTLSRALSNTSQSSDKAMADGEDVHLGRQLSNETAISPQKQIDGAGDGKVGTKLVTDEASETGKVKRGVYIYYLSSIGMVMGILTILANIGSQSAAVGSNIWLSEWSNDKPTVNGTQDTQLRDLRLGIYGLLGFLQAVLLLIGSVSMAYGMITASRLLHTQMLDNILHSPMSFFDTTPLGRIVNRFSKDVDVVDSALPNIMRNWLNCSVQLAATLIVISTSTPIFVAVIVPVGILYYFIQKFYVATSRQLKRLESVSRSPIYSHFSESINGAVTIRAYHRQLEFIRRSERKVDENQICYYPSIISTRWLAIRLEFVGSIIVFSAALFAVLGRDTMNPGLVGLSVSYALSGTVVLNWMVRTSSELETKIVAVERIKEYSETPQEAAWQIEEKKPPEAWPESGEIQFKNYSTRYRSGLDLILNGVSCSIERGEKIGIVGRTGAGKSSLTLALFRLIEPAGGTIVIDGVDVAKIGLHDLRKKLTIIPQDPVLFSGTLRINLDPFNVHSDEDLWKALEHSHLKAFAETLPAGLQHEVAEGGENLSVGQRQLVCLARALLRKTKILVLDEATAAVDLETDDLIQATISKEFHQCTVLVIAHRLNTIMDSNRVLVLDQGQIKEFDSPSQLLENRRSIFYGMAKDAGLV